MSELNDLHHNHQPKLTLLMEQHKKSFTKSEKKVYEYALNHFESIIYQSLTEISMACNIGESTVLRFCRKLGFKGYQDFKFAVAQEIAAPQHQDKNETFSDKIKSNMIQALENTSSIIDFNELEATIDKILEARDIVIFGMASSGIAGLDMNNRLLRIGVNSNAITDSHMQMIRAVSTRSDTLIIAISLTGSTKDTVDAVKRAKANGATVVAITNYSNSPLTKFSDHVLLTSAKENPLDSGSLVSKVSQLYVVDLICTGLTMKMYEAAEENKKKVAEAISEKLY